VTIPPIIPNPFDLVDDDTLFQMQVALEYGCLRSKQTVTQPHKNYICSLGQVLKSQADARGNKSPQFPFPPK